MRRLTLALLATCLLTAPTWAQLPRPALDGGAIRVRPTGIPNSLPARTLADRAADVVQAADHGVVCDGVADMAPALQALLNRIAAAPSQIVQLPPGVCLWNTSVGVRFALRLRGHGAHGAGGKGAGTTLRTTNAAITPLTLTADAIGAVPQISFTTDGAEISDLAIEQAHPTPAAGWTPTVYPPFFHNASAPGVSYRNITGYGIYAGIRNTGNSGRLEVRQLRGHFFLYAVYDDESFDNVILSDFHIWPYWSSHEAVIAWGQANTDAIRFLRSDSPQLDQIVVFGARSGIRLSRSAQGIPSKIQIGSLNTDATRLGIWADSGTNITMQIAQMTHQGASGVSTPLALPGSTAIRVDQDAGAIIQIGSLHSEWDDKHTVALYSTTNRSLVRINNMFVRDILGGGTSSLFYAAGTGANLPHDIEVATTPMVAPNNYLPPINLATTNALMQVPGAEVQFVYGVPTSGGTYGITNTRRNLVLASSNANPVPSLTIALPPNPYEGMEASIMVTVPVQSAQFSSGSIVVGAPSSLAAYQTVRFKFYYSGADYAWTRW